MKFFLVFASLLLFVANCESARSPNLECDFSNPKQRADGGFPGITQRQCESLGYCFDDTIPDVTWCIKSLKKLNNSQCNFQNPQNRIEGGFPGVSSTECVTKGNCFDDSTPNTKWCFKNNVRACNIFNVNFCFTPNKAEEAEGVV